MKRIVLVLSLVFLSGCSWFVPGKVKSEAVMMRVNIETAIEETEALPEDASKQKALRALRRMYPHVINWDDYVHGRPATRQYDPKYFPPAEVITPRSSDVR
jgi:hypothetical protein